MNIDKAFEQAELRAQIMRLTVPEMLVASGVKRHTYWRARKGLHAKADSRVSVLRKVEDTLSELEKERRDEAV